MTDSLTSIGQMHKQKLSASDFANEFNTPDRDDWQKPDSVIALLGDVRGRTILDLGAGTGYFTFKLAEKGAHVIAADVVENYLLFIEKTLAESEVEYDGEIETRLVPYESCSLDESEVDVVLLVDTYHHIQNRDEYFKEVFDGMEEGGIMMVVDAKIESCIDEEPLMKTRLPYTQVTTELEGAGFVLESTNLELLECQYILMFRK